MKKRRIEFFALGGIALSVVVMAFLLSELTLRQLFPEKEMASMVIQVDKNGETASSVQFFSYEAEYGALMNTPIRDKENDRPTYVYITDAPSSYTCVQVVSRYDGVPVNLTTVNANIVGYVMCRIGIKYSVHNVVYENGYRKAQLGLKKANYGSGSLTVTWSPDSLNNYVDAT